MSAKIIKMKGLKKPNERQTLISKFHEALCKTNGCHIVIATYDDESKVSVAVQGNTMSLSGLVAHLATDEDCAMAVKLGVFQAMMKK